MQRKFKGQVTSLPTYSIRTMGHTHTHTNLSFKKVNSKWTDLNVKVRTIKLPEDNTGENISDQGFTIDFQIKHQKHDPLKKKMMK